MSIYAGPATLILRQVLENGTLEYINQKGDKLTVLQIKCTTSFVVFQHKCVRRLFYLTAKKA